MLQIIHDLAPGAKLYYATAYSTQENFANNIRALRKAGCDIIVDDVRYFGEAVFQDGTVAQAVNEVTASGALYFSSAGNEGNKSDGTSGVWEGNYVDGGSAPLGLGGKIHKFSNSALFNSLTQDSGPITLQWSDPFGKSANDYDLFVLNSAGTEIIDASTNIQNGDDDPFESVGSQSKGNRVIIVNYNAAPRYLHLNTNRGRLSINTTGQISGHSAAEKAFSVAAVKAQNRTTLFTTTDRVETFSADGVRRIFYKADGTPLKEDENFLSPGGVVRQKADIAAADGVKTTLPSGSGLNPFFGTSAAAPHAAAVAALLKSYKPSLSAAQIRSLLTSTALDIEAKGVDQDSGYGIVMANRVLQKAAQTP
jgi:subtilisin family serine protease